MVTYADSSSVTFSYDAASHLTEAYDSADPHRPITFTYDPLDRLAKETTPLGIVGYTYDDAGRRLTMTAPGQKAVAYTYDHNSRLHTITQSTTWPSNFACRLSARS